MALGGAAPRIITVNDTTAVNDVTLSAVLSGVNFQKDGAGRLALSGDNSAYAGTITVNGGELVVQHANALGQCDRQHQSQRRLQLLIDGVSTAEPLSLNGAGFGGQGAIRNIAGNNTWTGPVTLAAAATVGVSAATSLNVNAAIGEAAAALGLTKFLPGTLHLLRRRSKHLHRPTHVSEGTLQLNKTAGVNAIAGTLTVGNDAGPQDSDLVQLLASDQIADASLVQITPSGHLNLNNNNESLQTAVAGNSLNFFNAVTTFPKLSTGAGTLTLGGAAGFSSINVNGLVTGITINTTASPGATINGNLALQTAAGPAVLRTFNATDAGIGIQELIVNATIFDGFVGSSINRTGTGLVVINSNNSATYTGTTHCRRAAAWWPATTTLWVPAALNVAANIRSSRPTTAASPRPLPSPTTSR